MQILSNSIQIVHCLLKEVLTSAKVIVDATTGNGFDTIFLAKNAQENARIYAFDIQDKALENAKKAMNEVKDKINLPLENIKYIHASHDEFDKYINENIDLVIFNLGYLPGGNHEITTQTSTTLKAIEKFIAKLNVHGHIAIVMYPGHEEGFCEYQAIEKMVKVLEKKSFTVGWYKMINHNINAPTLCWIEKVGEGHEINKTCTN